jgi:hypothetical protein
MGKWDCDEARDPLELAWATAWLAVFEGPGPAGTMRGRVGRTILSEVGEQVDDELVAGPFLVVLRSVVFFRYACIVSYKASVMPIVLHTLHR